MIEKLNATQALLDANGHLDVVPGDTVLAAQVTAPVTQEMLDADPALVDAGIKVGDLLNAPASKTFSASFTGTINADGTFTAQVTGDFTGNATGTLNADGSFEGSFDGEVPPSAQA